VKVRERHWIPRLRRLVKRVIIKDCHQVIGIDYAGPLRYRKSKGKRKEYILLYACSFTREVLSRSPSEYGDIRGS
jgi:hypothetical protein